MAVIHHRCFPGPFDLISVLCVCVLGLAQQLIADLAVLNLFYISLMDLFGMFSLMKDAGLFEI